MLFVQYDDLLKYFLVAFEMVDRVTEIIDWLLLLFVDVFILMPAGN